MIPDSPPPDRFTYHFWMWKRLGFFLSPPDISSKGHFPNVTSSRGWGRGSQNTSWGGVGGNKDMKHVKTSWNFSYLSLWGSHLVLKFAVSCFLHPPLSAQILKFARPGCIMRDAILFNDCCGLGKFSSLRKLSSMHWYTSIIGLGNVSTLGSARK